MISRRSTIILANIFQARHHQQGLGISDWFYERDYPERFRDLINAYMHPNFKSIILKMGEGEMCRKTTRSYRFMQAREEATALLFRMTEDLLKKFEEADNKINNPPHLMLPGALALMMQAVNYEAVKNLKNSLELDGYIFNGKRLLKPECVKGFETKK